MGGQPYIVIFDPGFRPSSQGAQYVATATAAEIAANQKEDEELLLSLFQGNGMYLEEITADSVKLSKIIDLM